MIAFIAPQGENLKSLKVNRFPSQMLKFAEIGWFFSKSKIFQIRKILTLAGLLP
jgi:hypothetical protein